MNELLNKCCKLQILSPTFGLFTGPPASDATCFGRICAEFEPVDAVVSRFVFRPKDSSVDGFIGFAAAV